MFQSPLRWRASEGPGYEPKSLAALHHPLLIDSVKTLEAQTLEPLIVLGHMTKGIAPCGFAGDTKVLDHRIQKSSVEKLDQEPKNAGHLWKLRQVKKGHLPTLSSFSHQEQSCRALGLGGKAPPQTSPRESLGPPGYCPSPKCNQVFLS